MRVFSRRSVAGAIVCALVVAAGVVVWWRLDAARPGTAAQQDRLQYFAVPTSTWQVGTAGKQAGLSGTLGFTAEGCPFVGDGEGRRTWVVMPAGARGVTVDGKRSIVDQKDFLYGTEGDQVAWGGGGEWSAKNACDPPDSHRFGVQMAPQTVRIDGAPAIPLPPATDLGDPPCQKSDDPPDDVDHFDSSAVALRFDHRLRDYTSYAATVWHPGGGMRVRIAAGRGDTGAARAEAERIIASLPTAYRHAVKINETTASLDQVGGWVAAARNGLTYIPAENILDIYSSAVCLSVDIVVKAHSAVRLTSQERERYRLSGFQLVARP